MSFWKYHKRDDLMGVDTSIFDKALPPSGFSDEELLAREGLQNCKDAAEKDENNRPQLVQVEVGKFDLSGESKQKLFTALRFHEQKEHFHRIQDSKRRNSLPTFLDDNAPLSVVYFADHNTVGLGGKWKGSGPTANFSNLVVNISRSSKDPSAGGSFGFGKTAYAKASGLRLVLYYSHFKAEQEIEFEEPVESRFMAVWLLKVNEEESISGFAFYGGESHKSPGSLVPLINNQAHEMAQNCGLKTREKGDYGATIAIVDCDINMDHFKEAVEKYWWPSIHDHRLAVKFVNGASTLWAEPHINEFVKPYWQMYDYMQVGQGTLPDGCISKTLNKIEGISRGRLFYRPILPDEKELILDSQKALYPNFDDQTLAMKVGGLARIRDAGMVLSYDLLSMDPARRPIAGLFVADSSIDRILRASEPQTHDRWDEHAKNRIMAASEESGFNVHLALRIVSSINSTLSRFISDATNDQPLPPPPDGYRLRNIENLLSKFINSGRGSIPSSNRPCSLKVQASRRDINGSRVDIANIDLRMKDGDDFNSLGDNLKCIVVVDCVLLGDTTGSAVSRIPCTLEDKLTGKQGSVIDGSTTIVIELKRGETYELVAMCKPGLHDVIRFDVEVKPPKSKNKKPVKN
jgi:hypothetical protein